MTGCCVPHCNNRTEKGFRLFRIPRNEPRRSIWIKLIARGELPLRAEICEAHFDEHQYENKRADKRKLLRSDAIPVLLKTENLVYNNQQTVSLADEKEVRAANFTQRQNIEDRNREECTTKCNDKKYSNIRLWLDQNDIHETLHSSNVLLDHSYSSRNQYKSSCQDDHNYCLRIEDQLAIEYEQPPQSITYSPMRVPSLHQDKLEQNLEYLRVDYSMNLYNCSQEIAKPRNADVVDLFFKRMAATVKKFSPNLITQARSKIFRIVSKIDIINRQTR